MSDQPGTGKSALITGASGGIGEAFTNLLAAEGYRLIITARSDDQLNRVAGVLSTKHQASVSPVALDLSKPDAAETLQNELKSRNFSPDVVINNAGFGKHGRTLDTPIQEHMNMVDLNVRCLSDLTLRLLPAMLERKRGGILNVASLAAFMPGPHMPVYHATKAYVLSFTEALASEYAGSGVTISALCPGYVQTGFQSRAGMEELPVLKFAPKLPAEEVASIGWEAFKRGDRLIIPGTVNKILAQSVRFMPRQMVSQVVRFINKPPADAPGDEPA
ncbi:MAG: SDR family NAD(P)-dependent oxidoreductase [Aestuariivirgaceae bacterium]